MDIFFYSNGFLDRYKARPVALGNIQEYSVIYDETFYPKTKMSIMRTILAIAASKGSSLHQMDGRNIFLHCDLKEVIFDSPPSLFSTSSSAVCKLKLLFMG